MSETLPDPVVWPEFPDPRAADAPGGPTCRVSATGRVLRHIAAKHVGDPAEPWRDWLGVRLAGRLAEADGTPDAGALAALGEALAEQAGRCLGAPLVIRLHREGPGGHDPHEAWLLALPAGALMVIHAREPGPHLATCFHENSTKALDPAGRRCRFLQAVLLGRYFVPDGARLVPRTAANPRVVRTPTPADPARRRHEYPLAFVTPPHWGVGDDGDIARARAAYRYPEDGPPPRPAPRARRLAPRFRPPGAYPT